MQQEQEAEAGYQDEDDINEDVGEDMDEEGEDQIDAREAEA